MITAGYTNGRVEVLGKIALATLAMNRVFSPWVQTVLW